MLSAGRLGRLPGPLALALAAAVAAAGMAASPVAAANRIFTIAGRGPDRGALPFGDFGGDGGIATDAQLATPTDVDVSPRGVILVADAENGRVRRVGRRGAIRTVAGGGSLDAASAERATEARLAFPVAVELLPDGGFVVADSEGSRVLRIRRNGSISVLAGTGHRGFAGDRGPATQADFRYPSDVVRTPDGGILIADTGNQRVRRVEPNGTVHTVAGDGTFGYSGDGAPATSASFRAPTGVALDSRGGILVTDSENDRIRRVGPNGIVRTVAGSGHRGFRGDGGAAVAARLYEPLSSAARGAQILIADTGNNRVRKVGKRGVIATLAGRGGAGGFAGDGGPAVGARLRTPTAAVPDPLGGVVLADTDNNVVRFVASARTRRLALALRRRITRKSGCPVGVPYRVTRAAAVSATLRRGERRRRVEDHAGKGANVVSLGKPRAGRYTLRLLVRAPDGQTTSHAALLTIERERRRDC